MKWLKEYFKIYTLSLLRQSSYIVPTLIFPSLFFLLFAHPNADTKAKAHLLLGSFSAFAVLGVAFLQYAVEAAHEKSSSWNLYAKSLPCPRYIPLIARTLVSIVMSLLSSWVVVLVVHLSTPAHLEMQEFIKMSVVLIFGSLPFCLLALCIAEMVSAKSSLPIANLFYIVLSFAGGLWMPPEALPKKVQEISDYLPTRAYGECVWASLGLKTLEIKYIWILIVYTIIFLVVKTQFQSIRNAWIAIRKPVVPRKNHDTMT